MFCFIFCGGSCFCSWARFETVKVGWAYACVCVHLRETVLLWFRVCMFVSSEYNDDNDGGGGDDGDKVGHVGTQL